MGFNFRRTENLIQHDFFHEKPFLKKNQKAYIKISIQKVGCGTLVKVPACARKTKDNFSDNFNHTYFPII